MKAHLVLSSALVVLGSALTSVSAHADPAAHPCAEVKKACETAGFKAGQAKDGTGLWLDCVDPLIQGKPQPAKAKIKLPTVDAKVIADCKAKHANWGEGHKK